MSKTYITTFFLVMLTVGMIFPFVNVGKAQMASLYVDPAEVTGLEIGDSFTVDVRISNVVELAGWEFQLFWNSQVLNGTAVTEGPFLKDVQSTFFMFPNFTDHYNSTSGFAYVACATLPTTGVDGSGVLASISFKIVSAGQSILALPLDKSKLLDSTPFGQGGPLKIPHTVTNGLVSVIGADIAVTNIQVQKSVTADPQITVNVTAANQGNYSASFDVTLYYDSNAISTQSTTNLAPSASIIFVFVWDLASVPKGNYTIKAYAPPITGENNVDNNQLIDGWIRKTIKGDINGDGMVNIVDVTLVAAIYTAKRGDPNWNPNADLDNNDLINIVDVTTVATKFGQVDP